MPQAACAAFCCSCWPRGSGSAKAGVEAIPAAPSTVLLVRLMNATHTLKAYGLWLIVLLGALYLVLCVLRPGAKALALPPVFFVLALAANYALILSPVYYIRSFYPVLAFLVLAIGSCLMGLAGALPRAAACHRLRRRARCAPCCALTFWRAAMTSPATTPCAGCGTAGSPRRSPRACAKSKPMRCSPTPVFAALTASRTFRRDPGNWVNVNMALYLGADSIAATEQHYYPFPRL